MPSNLMPFAASIVVLIYAVGVLVRHTGLWYEWLAAAAGIGFMVWYWLMEWSRARRKGPRGR